MATTIFALSGVPAPEGIDGKNLLPLLADLKDRVRDALPLLNFWGTKSAQSMAVVTSEWKYIDWYYGQGMKPTEELFHLGQDRYEIANIAGEPRYGEDLATMGKACDKELAAIKATVVKGHGYEAYPVLFDRAVAWAGKVQLLKKLTAESVEGEPPKAKREKRKAGAK